MPAAVGGICALIYLLTAGYGMTSGDVTAANVLSWQIGTVGDPAFRSDTYPALDQHRFRYVWITEDADGDEVIGRSPGAVIASVPAYALFGADGFSRAPAAVTAALLTAAAVALMAACLQRMMRRRDAMLSALIFGITTPVWSVAADGMWPHTITVLGICGMAWAAGRNRWLLVGLFGGVAIWGRVHAVVIVAIVGLLIGYRRRNLGIVVYVAGASIALLALESLWSRWLYGSWSPTASYGLGIGDNPFTVASDGALINQLGFWVSLDRGLLVWSPTILLLLPALWRSWSRLPDWSRALLWGGLAYTVVQGIRNVFGGGDGFYGYRLTLELLACAVPALALAAPQMGRVARSAFGPVVVFQALVISVGAIDGRIASPAERAWSHHTLLSAMAQQPVALAGLVVLCAGLGILAQRIWEQPSLRQHEHPPPSDAASTLESVESSSTSAAPAESTPRSRE